MSPPQCYTNAMKKLVIVLLVLLFPAACLSDTIVWTDDGYRGARTNESGQALLLRHATQQQDGLVIDTDAEALLIGTDDETVWRQQIGGNGDDELRDAVALADGWFCVGASASSDLSNGYHGGTYDDKEGKSDGFIARLSSDGDLLYTRCFGGSDWDRLRGVCRTSDGGFLAVGETYSRDGDISGWHDSGELFDKPDGWVIRLSETGELLWQLCIGGSGFDTLLAVVPLDSGYMAIGETDSVDGDLEGVNAFSPGEKRGFVAIFSDEGEIKSTHAFGGPGETGFVTAAKGHGGVLVGGYHWPSPSTEAKQQAYIAFLSETGDMLWDAQFGSMDNDCVTAIVAEDAVAGFTLSGHSQRSLVVETASWVASVSKDGGDVSLLRGSYDVEENAAQ